MLLRTPKTPSPIKVLHDSVISVARGYRGTNERQLLSMCLVWVLEPAESFLLPVALCYFFHNYVCVQFLCFTVYFCLVVFSLSHILYCITVYTVYTIFPTTYTGHIEESTETKLSNVYTQIVLQY